MKNLNLFLLLLLSFVVHDISAQITGSKLLAPSSVSAIHFTTIMAEIKSVPFSGIYSVYPDSCLSQVTWGGKTIKTGYTYNADKKIALAKEYTNGENTRTIRSEYDQKGNPTQIVDSVKEYGAWSVTKAVIANTYSGNVLVSAINSSYEDNNPAEMMKFTYHYNQTKREQVDSIMIYTSASGNYWVKAGVFRNQYDAMGNITKQESVIYFMGTPLIYAKEIYAFTAGGQLTSMEKYSMFYGESDWTGENKYVFIVDDSQRLTSYECFEWDLYENNWKESKSEYGTFFYKGDITAINKVDALQSAVWCDGRNIHIPEGVDVTSIQVYDTVGSVVYRANAVSGNSTINLSERLKSGVYIVKLGNSIGNAVKIVIK